MAKSKKTVLSNSQVRELVQNPLSKRDDELSALARSDAYELEDGRFLIVREDGKGLIWERAEITAIANRAEKPVHVLSGLVDDGSDFVARASELADQLADRLNLAKERLDYSLDSLKLVDDVVFKKVGREAFLTADHFPPLLAYVGEVVRRRVGPFARWRTRLASDGVTNEPWVVDANGKSYMVFMHVFEDLHEDDSPQSLWATALGIKPTRYLPVR